MEKTACIVAVGVWANKKCLLKNRDRNYTPEVKIVHDLVDGVEIAYMNDLGTDWCEGMNEHSIGIVNAALMVGRDEAEKKIVNTVGKKSKDGERILKALSSKNLEEAVKSVVEYNSGVKGHTFVADRDSTKSIEMTSKHEAVVKTLKGGVVHVRTNHGFAYPNAGYTEGPNYVSSVARRDQAMEVLRDEVTEPEDIVPELMQHRHEDLDDPNNMVRDTDNMATTSQMVLNLTDREILFYCVDKNCQWKGIENRLPGGREPKIKVQVFEFKGDSSKPVKVPYKEFKAEKSKSKEASMVDLASKIASEYMKQASGEYRLHLVTQQARQKLLKILAELNRVDKDYREELDKFKFPGMQKAGDPLEATSILKDGDDAGDPSGELQKYIDFMERSEKELFAASGLD